MSVALARFPNRERQLVLWPNSDFQRRDVSHLRCSPGRVGAALKSLPAYFRSETFIEGISAIDIFTLNSALGATIENQVVDALSLRFMQTEAALTER